MKEMFFNGVILGIVICIYFDFQNQFRLNDDYSFVESYNEDGSINSSFICNSAFNKLNPYQLDKCTSSYGYEDYVGNADLTMLQPQAQLNST